MKAIDTNVALRLITGDDKDQMIKAQLLLAEETVFVTLSVAMEIEWVLRSGYKWSPVVIADALAAFVKLDAIEAEELGGLSWAIDRMRAGADFADMLHLLSAHEADAFVTFDRRLAARAGLHTPVMVETLR